MMADFDPRIFKSLRSADPEERKKGVKALAQTHDKEAMRYLATIYKTDPDSSVRELALDAGKHIKRMIIQGDWVGDGIKNPTQEMRALSSVPAADQQQSKKIMEAALDKVMNEEYESAELLARQAFVLNPDLKHDPYYTGIASDIVGMSAEEAVKYLLRPMEE